MISETDLKEILPVELASSPTAGHVQAGLPIAKAARIQTFSPDEWEAFVEEWATSLASSYQRVRRFAGSGDQGIDIAGFLTEQGFIDEWDNYQCKRYNHPLYPSDIWVEIGKIVYYSFTGEFNPPKNHYFIASKGIGTTLEQLLSNSPELKIQARQNWADHCEAKITSTTSIPLSGNLLDYFERFDFKIFKSKSQLELIDEHAKTNYHVVRFGGGLPLRPTVDTPPSEPALHESRYIRQLLNAYGSHLGTPLSDPTALSSHDNLHRDYLRQRERFYNAEGLKNFARDNVPKGTFESLQEEIFQGVVDVSESAHPNGFERMKATITQAASVACTSNPLASSVKAQDRQGICHQLANEDQLTWVPDHEV